MNDDDMRIVRENIERHEERQQEQRQSLRREFEHLADFSDAIELGKKYTILGIIPSVGWIIHVGIAVGHPIAVVGVVLGWICCGIVAYFTPVASALLVHYWFRNSGFPAPRVALALTLLIEAAFFGWVIVLTHS